MTASIDTARTASLAARQARALDRLTRDGQGHVATYRARIEGGAYAYRVARTYADGKTRYGLIERADADSTLADAPEGGRSLYPGHGDPLQELTFAPYVECAKLVFDYADALPAVKVAPDLFEVERVITDAEWAHLTGRAVAALEG